MVGHLVAPGVAVTEPPTNKIMVDLIPSWLTCPRLTQSYTDAMWNKGKLIARPTIA